MGADGVNPIRLQIWVGDGDRQWLEVRYFDESTIPLGAIKTVVPEGPDHPSALLDACIAFYPAHFHGCPSMAAVSAKLESVTRLDFDAGRGKIPDGWWQLRTEARSLMKSLCIYEAILKPIAFPVGGQR
jgi:hypothetical protein